MGFVLRQAKRPLDFSGRLQCKKAELSLLSLDGLLLLQQVTDLSQQFFLRGTLRCLWLWSGLFLLAVQLVDALQHEEDTEGDDDEVHRVLDEVTVVQHGSFLALTNLE